MARWMVWVSDEPRLQNDKRKDDKSNNISPSVRYAAKQDHEKKEKKEKRKGKKRGERKEPMRICVNVSVCGTPLFSHSNKESEKGLV